MPQTRFKKIIVFRMLIRAVSFLPHATPHTTQAKFFFSTEIFLIIFS